jgi:hypothetical protein
MDKTIFLLSITNGSRLLFVEKTVYSDTEHNKKLDQCTVNINDAIWFNTENEANDYRFNVAAGSNWQVQPISKKKLFKMKLSA